MRAPSDLCSKRTAVVSLASGLVISLTALTGGIAPAYAKPNTDPSGPTTTVAVPQPEAPAPQPKTPEAPIVQEAPVQESPVQEAPPKAPVVETAAPTVEAPPQTQAPDPPPQVVQMTTAPTAVAPPATTVTPPATTTAPPATSAERPSPRVAAPATPETTGPASETSEQAPVTIERAPATSAVPSPSSTAPATTSAAATASVAPTAALAPGENSMETSQAPAARDTSAARETSAASAIPTSASASPDASGDSTVSVSQAAKAIERSEPQTLQAPKEDVEIAKTAKVVEAKPDPAPEQDIDALASSLNLDVNERRVDAAASAEVRLGSDRVDRVRDRTIRQWSPDWVQYDDYYRPILMNPYRDPVRVVYVYQNAPRIVWIPPLARVVLEVAQFAAYSFTAVVATAANIVNTAVQTAVDVAVGSFFGGGYYPGVGLPLPPPPPPVLRYDNVPVQVRYSQATYEPFRVQRIVDVGDDPQFGERKVLLDGATPAWGVWTQTPSGERQFEVHRTQQYPGLDNPQEAPLPGDYHLVLASDDAPSGLTARDIFLIVAAAVIAVLGFGAIGMAVYLGRRRPQH
ncbi:hypothetical protein ACVWWN_003849 [Mycobacterium sp. URHB0021]